MGWLSYLADPDPGVALLREGMRELGYVEGKSYLIVARFASGDFTQLPRLVDELAGERVDVIVSRPLRGFHEINPVADTGRIRLQRRSDRSGLRRQLA